MLVGFAGVAILVGVSVSFKDLGAVGEVGLVAIGYAVGPIIIARRLPSLPAVGVVAASLVLTALLYAAVAIPQLPSEVGPVRATVITYFNPAVALLLGVALLREPFTVAAVVGFSLILVGSVLATRRTSALAGRAAVPSSTAWGAVARYRRARQHRSQG